MLLSAAMPFIFIPRKIIFATKLRTMDHAMPVPLPSAVKAFHAGRMMRDHVKYPHLPKAPSVRLPAVPLPALSRTGKGCPATKLPMGMTLPIMTRRGAHPLDTASSLPPIGTEPGFPMPMKGGRRMDAIIPAPKKPRRYR